MNATQTYFAVFNTRPDELESARISFTERFGEEAYRDEIAPVVEQGLMSIFNSPPNEHTRCFVDTLAAAVTERLGDSFVKQFQDEENEPAD